MAIFYDVFYKFQIFITLKFNSSTQQNTKKLSLVVNNTAVGFWDWNITLELVECNSRWYEITGYNKVELAPFTLEKFGSLIHPDDALTVMQQLEKHISNEREIYAYMG